MKPFHSFALLLFLFSMRIVHAAPSKGFEEHKLNWQGIERNYYTYVPDQAQKRQPLPLLMALHGGNGTGKGFPNYLKGRFEELADRDGFLVVYPSGINKGWNHGLDPDMAPSRSQLDDVGFLEEVISSLRKQYYIDSTRIFITGISAGGWMTARMLCERTDLFAGAAIVAATQLEENFATCKPVGPISLLVINGTEDPILPYHGGQLLPSSQNELFKDTRVLGTQEFVDFWIRSNACKPVPTVQAMPDKNKYDAATVSKYTYTGGLDNTKVILYKIHGGGHTWPGQTFLLGSKALLGNMCKDFNACDDIWNFFKSL